MTAPTEVLVPDIGDFSSVPVIEVHVSAGDQVNAEDPLVTLESDKATLDVPAPSAGSVAEVLVKVGDEVSEGTPILMLAPGDGAVSTPPSLVEQQEPPSPPAAPPVTTDAAPGPALAAATGTPAGGVDTPTGLHAGPSVRRTARELGIDLATITATGPKGRITKDDLLTHLKAPTPAAGAAAPPPPPAPGSRTSPPRTSPSSGRPTPWPCPGSRKSPGPSCTAPGSTSRTSPTTTKPTSPTWTATARNWTPRPRTTRTPTGSPCWPSWSKPASPRSNSSPSSTPRLSPEKDALILKQYYNIGIAVDTPGGLVVPVVKDADRKGIVELSREFMAISAKARDGKLDPADMQGGTFTISSLGGIGGTSFTPIVNAPEVAILGVVRSKMAPVWNGTEFTPRNMLPLSVSYDHRVVDGALAARFTRHLCYLLEDDRRLLL